MARKQQPPTDPTSLLMTVGECAVALGVAEETITALVDSGRWIGSHRISRRCIISRAAFNRLYRDGIVAEPRAITTAPSSSTNPYLRKIS